MEKRIVYSFKRNENEEIKISTGVYKDKEYVDIRVFYLDKTSNDWRPTKKGITINRSLLSGLLEGLKQAEGEFSSLAAT